MGYADIGDGSRDLGSMSTEELDRLREVLVYILVEDSVLDFDEVYSLVFGNGRTITWH